MIIFRCELAKAMLRDVFETLDDWHCELGTVTGYDWDEYQALFERVTDTNFTPFSKVDSAMLRVAANQFFGYPGIRTENLQSSFGDAWEEHLNIFFRPWEG